MDSFISDGRSNQECWCEREDTRETFSTFRSSEGCSRRRGFRVQVRLGLKPGVKEWGYG